MSVMVGVALVGAIFYSMVNNHYLGLIIGQTQGPFSDILADMIFNNSDPDLWKKIATNHQLTIFVEPPDADPVGFNAKGERLTSFPPDPPPGQFHTRRVGEDGTRVTMFWTLWSFRETHLPLLGTLLVMAAAVVGSGFWFLQRQLKPLAWLQTGVEAVAHGNFDIRVPVVRADEIGQVAGSFNVMASKVGEMINDRERLLADVSHELRSPIARMKVALEFVPQGDKRDSLDHDLKEMESLIAALLEREELRTRGGQLKTTELDLDAVVGGIARAFSDQGASVNHRSTGPVMILADMTLMKLLIQNLVDNAIKFSLPGKQPVVIKLESEEERIVLRVLDDGIGIPPGSETNIFKPFVKLDPSRGHGTGYGIGLNLCQRIVQLHGGTIRLLPGKTGGTEAIVTLDRRPMPPPENAD